MIEKAFSLALTVYSPLESSAERMRSLFELNRIKLIGNSGRRFQEWLAAINRHYFFSDGSLRCFDPTARSYTHLQRVQELTILFKNTCAALRTSI